MTPDDFGPLLIVVSRDEVERNDTSGPLSTLRWLISTPEIARDFRTRVDINFDGYNDRLEELFEIPEVRNYVHTLDREFPFWLYFLSRDLLGLQCLTSCFLLPHLTDDARKAKHPEQLSNLVDNRWGPALNDLCSKIGLGKNDVCELLDSALEYFADGPSKPQSVDSGRPVYAGNDEHGKTVADDRQADDDHFALSASQKYVRDSLERACRTAMARLDQTPFSLALGALFLRAVLQLPKRIDQCAVSLRWETNEKTSWAMKSVTIGFDQLSVETTEAFDSGVGWDHETSIDWLVDESHQQGLDEWVLGNWQ